MLLIALGLEDEQKRRPLWFRTTFWMQTVRLLVYMYIIKITLWLEDLESI